MIDGIQEEDAGRNLKADQPQQNEWVTGQTSEHPPLWGIAFREPSEAHQRAAANDLPNCVKRKGKQIEMLAESTLKRARQWERNVDTKRPFMAFVPEADVGLEAMGGLQRWLLQESGHPGMGSLAAPSSRPLRPEIGASTTRLPIRSCELLLKPMPKIPLIPNEFFGNGSPSIAPKAFQEAHSQNPAEGSGQRVLFCPDWDIKVDKEALLNAEVSWKLIQGMVLPKDHERLSEKWANIDSMDEAMFTIAKLSYESTANMGFMLVHLKRKIAEEKRQVEEAKIRAKEAEERSREAEKRTQKTEEKLAVVASEKKKLEEQHISLEDANQQLQAQVQDLNTKLTKYHVSVERIATKVIAKEEALKSKAEQLQKRVEELEGEAKEQMEAIHKLKTGAMIPEAVKKKIFNEIMMSQDWKDAQADIVEGTANMLKSRIREKYPCLDLSCWADYFLEDELEPAVGMIVEVEHSSPSIEGQSASPPTLEASESP